MHGELDYRDGRFVPRFPFRDPACPRCAHCKARHLRATTTRPRVYIGDGLSDLCPARVAEIVFAKDSLADALGREGISFFPFSRLTDVHRHLRDLHGVSLMR